MEKHLGAVRGVGGVVIYLAQRTQRTRRHPPTSLHGAAGAGQSPNKQVMLYPPPPPPKVSPAPVFRSCENWEDAKETDIYGRTKYDREQEQLYDAEQQNRADLEEHKHEFREIDESTRYNDKDSWQYPWGDRD